MKHRSRTAAALSALTLVVVGACGSSDDGGSGDDTLTVGLIPIVDVAPIYLGIEQGFFEDEGLTIKPVLASGGAAIVPAVSSGSYQIGFSNNVSLITGASKGLDLPAIAPGVGISPSTESSTEGVGYCSVMSGPDGKVTTAKDLEGATVAVNTLNNIGDVTIREALRKKNVDASKVDFVEMPFPDMPAAVKGGNVDAVWVCEPFVTSLLQDQAKPLFNNYGEVDPNLPVASYFANRRWVEQNPETLASFKKALAKSMEYATDNPDEVRDVITKYTKIDPETADEIGLPDFPTEFNDEGLSTLIELSDQDGLLEKDVTVDDLVLSD